MAFYKWKSIGIGSNTVGGASKSISDGQVMAGSTIIPIPNGGILNGGNLTISSVVDGSFTISSSNILDARSFNYLILIQS